MGDRSKKTPQYRMQRTNINRQLMLAISLCLTGAMGGQAAPPDQNASQADEQLAAQKSYPTSVDDLRAIEGQVRQVVEKAMPATVAVRIGSSQGSGVIVTPDGYVLTAAHVVGKPGREAMIVLADGRQRKAITLGSSHESDSGLLKIAEPGPWPHVLMATDDVVRPGQWCVALGHPGGFVDQRSPVVRLGRVLFTNPRLICTDCTLIGGDSGGPLLAFNGQVIGIHSRIGGRATTNFHVPITLFHTDWKRLATGERWGGPEVASVEEQLKPMIGISGHADTSPCRIERVFPGSPAAKMGLRPDDVIEQIDQVAVESFRELAWVLREYEPGTQVSFTVRRGKRSRTMMLTLGGSRGKLPRGRRPPKRPMPSVPKTTK